MRPHRLRALCTVCALCASAGAAGMTFASCSSPTTEPTPDAGVPADVAASDAAAPSLQPPGWDQGLRMPALEDLNAAPGVVEVRLEAKVVPIAIGGQTLPMWTYQGILPGPVIRAKRGDRVLVHFTNSLPAPTTIHWHGLRVPNVMDGVPDVTQAPIPPGGTFDYEFRVPDAGTFWYHPHVASSTQVGYGLYGALVVDDPEGVAVVPPTDELTLVLSDVSITDAGALETPDATGGLGDYFGREGRPLVNGRVRGAVKARPGLPQRWRVVNASRARYAALELPGFDVYRLGGDVGFAEVARRLPFGIATVVPGERVELFVVPRGAPGQSIVGTWNTVDRLHTTAPPEKTPVLDVALEGEPVIGKDLPPAKLAAFEPVSGVDASAPPAHALAFVDDRGALSMSHTQGDGGMFTVRARTSEVWTVANMTGQDHPFHLHGFAFQVLDTGNGPPAQRELRDTVNVVARQRITIAIPFDDRVGTWMYHCHILDHADVGMMGMFMLH